MLIIHQSSSSLYRIFLASFTSATADYEICIIAEDSHNQKTLRWIPTRSKHSRYSLNNKSALDPLFEHIDLGNPFTCTAHASNEWRSPSKGKVGWGYTIFPSVTAMFYKIEQKIGEREVWSCVYMERRERGKIYIYIRKCISPQTLLESFRRIGGKGVQMRLLFPKCFSFSEFFPSLSRGDSCVAWLFLFLENLSCRRCLMKYIDKTWKRIFIKYLVIVYNSKGIINRLINLLTHKSVMSTISSLYLRIKKVFSYSPCGSWKSLMV